MPAAHSGPAENLFVSTITILDALVAATTLVHRINGRFLDLTVQSRAR